MSLKERVHEIEGHSEEAFWARRQLVRLLVEGIIIEDKRASEEPRVRIMYRFEEPGASENEPLCEVSRNTNESLEAKARAGR